VAEDYIKDTNNNVYVLASKSLHTNFINTISAETQKKQSDIDERYKFISLNASNMLSQVFNIKKTDDELKQEKKIENFSVDAFKQNPLNNTAIIMDEAHNFFNSVTNGSKNALGLYDLMMEAKNLKILFLTGTPIRNEPFEIVPCFNLLYGPIFENLKYDKRKKKEYYTLFSEDAQEFEDYFIDVKANSIKNADKFKNRIFGLTCYYGDLYLPPKTVQEGFPKKLPDIIEKIPMSKTQFSRYMDARIKEQAESKFVAGQKSRFSATRSSNSTYRVQSRQISNFCIPEYALGPIIGKKSREKLIDKITDTDIADKEYSPKFAAIYKNIAASDSKLQIIYSQFVSGEGLALFARYLEVQGYRSYQHMQDDNGLEQKHNPVYALLTGDIDIEERQNIIDIFNDVTNSHGERVKLLLLSSAVAEGIDLKRVRCVHIMEPFWNYSRIRQVETRAIRYLSHADLPPEEQNVQVYIYLSDYPLDYPKDKIIEPTTDVDLLSSSIKNMKLINTFIHAITESSIDCSIHAKDFTPEIQKNIHCQICRPTNRPLFLKSLQEDMTYANPCILFEETKVKVKAITVEDNGKIYTYYYKKDPDLKLYEYDEKIKGYIPIRLSNRHVSEIMKKLADD
jgi:superfamily II DNA or RNA helicase